MSQCPQESQLLSQSGILEQICSRIPDNNAGSISAADVRQPMQNLAFSVNKIVAEGDHNNAFPFLGDVKTEGNFVLGEDGGIVFVQYPGRQTEPFLGASNIDHNDLSNRASNDCHPNYLTIDGSRPMNGNIQMGSGNIHFSNNESPARGLKFGREGNRDFVQVAGSTDFSFTDGSKMTSARGVAKAWISFDASDFSIKAAHNISILERLEAGKFKITIPSGVLKNENCVLMGHSNSRSAASSPEDFDRNHVGLVDRTFTPSGQVIVTFFVLNENSQYVNAEINDLVVFGYDVSDSYNLNTVVRIDDGAPVVDPDGIIG